MGKKRFEARGFAQEWAERKEKRDAAEAKKEAASKAKKKAAKASVNNTPSKQFFFIFILKTRPLSNSGLFYVLIKKPQL